MKILSFLGLWGAVALIVMTTFINNQGCSNTGCDCLFELKHQEYYTAASFVFSEFYLIYCVLFLFKISGQKTNFQKEKSDRLLDSDLINEHYTMYQLPIVRFLTISGFLMSFALLGFTFIISNASCFTDSCDLTNCTNQFSYDQEFYQLGYGISGAYFLILTLVSLLKSYPSKY